MILVTGGLGFIGAHTTRALLDQGAAVLPASRTPRVSPLLPSALTTTRIDCTDPESLSALGRQHRITTIVHLAAAPLGGQAPLTELGENTEALLAVLRAAAAWNTTRVVIASTIGVYAGVATIPWREDLPLPMASAHPIPAAKKSAEILALASGLDVVIARIGAIWGPGGRPASPFFAAPGLVHAAAAHATATGPANLDAAAVHATATGTGHVGAAPHATTASPGQAHVPAADATTAIPATRTGATAVTGTGVDAGGGADMLYAPDCGSALALLATAATLEHRTYNIGSGKVTTNGAVAAALADLAPGFDARLRAGGSTDPIPYLDNGRLRAAGWEPRWPVRKATNDYFSWLAAGNSR